MKYCWILASFFICLSFLSINAAGYDISHTGDLTLIGNLEYGNIFVDGTLTVHGSLTCKKLIAKKVKVTQNLIVEPDFPSIDPRNNQNIFAIDIIKSIEVLKSCIALGNVRAPDIIAGSLSALGVDAHSLTVETLTVPDENFHVAYIYYKKATVD